MEGSTKRNGPKELVEFVTENLRKHLHTGSHEASQQTGHWPGRGKKDSRRQPLQVPQIWNSAAASFDWRNRQRKDTSGHDSHDLDSQPLCRCTLCQPKRQPDHGCRMVW